MDNCGYKYILPSYSKNPNRKLCPFAESVIYICNTLLLIDTYNNYNPNKIVDPTNI